MRREQSGQVSMLGSVNQLSIIVNAIPEIEKTLETKNFPTFDYTVQVTTFSRGLHAYSHAGG
jgi:hypothetical protein